MSLVDQVLKRFEEDRLLKLLERQVSATERVADSLEALLPSPLTTPGFQSNTLKPPSSVDTFKIYGDKEAFIDEQRARRKQAETEELTEEDD
jgi:hypothetical protein